MNTPRTYLKAHLTRLYTLLLSFFYRVEEVQRLLSELTGSPPSDQIITHEGSPLAPSNLLADYGLAGTEEGEGRARDVFLYSKSLLRPDAANPPLETFPGPPGNSAVVASASEREGEGAHPLDSAPSPLLRALPEYRRQFRGHLQEAEAAAAAGATHVALSCRLLNEAEVQAMAVDAAMASVEPHYAFICNSQASFQQRFNRRYATHQDVLSTFDADVEFLNSVELPPQLRTEEATHLSDLVNLEELRGIAAECRRSHRRFASRVAELEALHTALRTDVEALFMRAPSVDLDGLSQGLAAAAAAADEEVTATQALAADCRRADSCVEDAMREVPAGLQDVVGMLEAMHESHVTTILPRVNECSAAIEEFARRCLEAKNALAIDALRTLRTIASQQSKIREMREALAPFPGALDRQDAQIARLLVVRRLPAAYKQALAECVRRAAFAEKYTAFAADLAERMGKFRLKESAMRDKFRSHVADHLPAEILERMGLDHPPPHCHVNVPGEEAALLLSVTPEDLRRLQLPRYSTSTGTSTGAIGGGGALEKDIPPGGMGGGYSPRVDLGPSASTGLLGGVASTVGAKEGSPGASGASPSSASSLQLQNAQLRAELASQIALSCIQAAELAALGPLAPAPAPQIPSGGSSSVGSSAGGATGGSGTIAQGVSFGQPGLSLGPEAVQKFEKALAAKDALMAAFKEEAGRENEALRRRIAELESRSTAARNDIETSTDTAIQPAVPLTQPQPAAHDQQQGETYSSSPTGTAVEGSSSLDRVSASAQVSSGGSGASRDDSSFKE